MKIVAVFLILETVCFLSSEAIPGYLGCVKAHINRFLTGKEIKSGDMTINKCNSLCMKHNYKFYGVQAGQWCFCGNTFQKTYRRPGRECNMRCAGNRRQPCGGHMRMNLFRNIGYLGCFQDQKDRVLTGKYKQDGMMTIPKCRDWCAKDKNKFFGLEDGGWCFCGNTLTKPVQKPERECNKRCRGNRRQRCGGFWKINIYKNLEIK